MVDASIPSASMSCEVTHYLWLVFLWCDSVFCLDLALNKLSEEKNTQSIDLPSLQRFQSYRVDWM